MYALTFFGSPARLGVTRGTLLPQIPCYPLGSQAPRPTSKLRTAARPRLHPLRPSHPSPAGDHLSLAATSVRQKQPGAALDGRHRRHLAHRAARLGAPPTTAPKGRSHGGPDSARPQRVNAWSARRAVTTPLRGESPHRSSRFHGAASLPLDPPAATDPTRQPTTEQLRVTPKRAGVPDNRLSSPFGMTHR
jgi:hypothetical protein